MTTHVLVAAIALLSIALYAIFGGADFGSGVWTLLASGPRRERQQTVIGHAIGPVWETNHVWLIFLIVLLFTCFPPAFAELSIGLYAPLSFVLVGIILRGAAYAFRQAAYRIAFVSRLWGRIFGVASILAPFFFGAAVGGLTVGGYAWTSPFALVIGVFAIALCAQLAAIFLAWETRNDLQDDFRARGIWATFALAAIGALALSVARFTAPHTLAQLSQPQALPGIGIAMALGFVVLFSLVGRRYTLARFAVAAQTIAILAGWYASQEPYLIPGGLTFDQAAAPEATLRAFLWLVAIGGALLVPSLWLLFHVFKSGPQVEDGPMHP